MITELYKDHLKKLNQKFNNKNIYDFEPNISNDFEKDKVIFSNFWRDCLKENKKELRSIIELTKKIFLKNYSSNIYNHITNNKVKIHQEIKDHRDGSRSFYCNDPDQNIVQIIWIPKISDK